MRKFTYILLTQNFITSITIELMTSAYKLKALQGYMSHSISNKKVHMSFMQPATKKRTGLRSAFHAGQFSGFTNFRFWHM